MMRDALTDAINAPAGRLAEILIKRMTKGESEEELSPEMQARFDKLASAGGEFGRLARVRFAAEVSVLFERIPNWTSERIIPLFDWSCVEAEDAWSARKYSNYIGSPKLFELTKKPFLALFGRPDIGEDELRTFGEWLIVVMLANQSGNATYALNAQEARSALRAAGPRVLPAVAHRLAVEMEAAAQDSKVETWRKVVGPVFNMVWPLDAELQSSNATFGLLQMLVATGGAFSEAADIIIPFVRSEDERHGRSLFLLSHADDGLFTSSSGKILDVAVAVIGDAPSKSVFGLKEILERVRHHAPWLIDNRRYQRLATQAIAY